MSFKKKVERTIMLLKKKNLVPIPEVVNDTDLLEDKVAMVIGGTGGIGGAITTELIHNNCKVISCGSSVESLRKMQSVLPESEKLKYFPFNLKNTKEYSQKIQSAVEIFGKIDILILSAGVHSEKLNYYDMTEEEYERIMQINLKAPFFLCQSFANYLINEKKTGHICLVSSSRGAEPAYTPYGISKWALNGMTKGIAQELIKYGIVVNAIAPGSTATPLIGVTSKDSIATDENSCGRLVHPNEVANIVKLLVSDTGNMIVGETVHISGGRGIFDIR